MYVFFVSLFRVEADFAAKLKALEEKHAKEIAEILGGASPPADAAVIDVNNNDAPEEAPKKSAEEEERERKQAKARKKREKAREKERERELQIERENAAAGPSLRQIEMEQIQEQLTPLGLKISEVASDGNCLYRAVAAALETGGTYQDTRKYSPVRDWFYAQTLLILMLPIGNHQSPSHLSFEII